MPFENINIRSIWLLLLMLSGIAVADTQPVKYPIELKLKNQDFSRGLENWEIKKDEATLKSDNEIEVLALSSENILKITAVASPKPVWRSIRQNLAVKTGDILKFTAQGRLENPQHGYGMFLLIAFLDKDGRQVSFVGGDSSGNVGGIWTNQNCRAIVPPGVLHARFEVVMHGQGVGYYKDLKVEIAGSVRSKPLSGSVQLDVTENITCDSLWGFGFEDDGWFYNKANVSQGVTAEDYELNNDRIEWIEPDWVRMFFWHRQWCPSSDGKTFTFESDGMQSHYKSLELYQRLGVPVVFAGTRWGQPTLYDDYDAFASSVGAIFDYLINRKGLTCVKYWTLVNEPNLDFFTPGDNSFAEYVEIHRRVKAEFARRGLDIKIVGSDDAASQIWFDKCVFEQDYYDIVDVMCSHMYFRPDETRLSGKWFAGRMDSMAVQSVKKPFVIGEYGFTQINRDSHKSPLMDTFSYALNNTEFCINMLNAGGSGAAIWTSHAAYYDDTNKLMDFGLWRYKDKDWSIRPVYHSVAMFTRMLRAGDKAYKVNSSHPWKVRAARAGDTVFWVNMSDENAPIKLNGFSASQATVLTETNLSGERACGDKVAVKDGIFTVPACSFGYMKGSR